MTAKKWGGGDEGVLYEGFSGIMTRQALFPFEKDRVDSCVFIIATLLGVVEKVTFSGCWKTKAKSVLVKLGKCCFYLQYFLYNINNDKSKQKYTQSHSSYRIETSHL